MNKITRGERLLQQLTDSGKLTPHGKDWLIAALDPMHDTLLQNLGGWPDVCDAPSIIRCHKESVTISCPSTVTSGTWDVVIQNNPILNNRSLRSLTHYNSAITGFVGAGRTLSAISIRSYRADSDYGISSPADDLTFIPVPTSILNGTGRLIGAGFETNNVTADLYKQGTCTVYRQPQPDRLGDVINLSEPWVSPSSIKYYFNTAIPVQPIVHQPADLNSAMSLAGSRQWPAADGAYSVVPFVSTHNPAGYPSFQQPLLTQDFANFKIDGVITSTTGDMQTPIPITLDTNENAASYANKYAPVHSSGQIFSGLSLQTSLTVTVNFYYEYFPTTADTALVSLARPSCGYDPVALELYSQALRSLPVGVPAGMNGLGDWFAAVISEFAPMIGKMVGVVVPGARLLGKGMGLAADHYLASQSPKSQAEMKRIREQSRAKKKKKTSESKDVRSSRALKRER